MKTIRLFVVVSLCAMFYSCKKTITYAYENVEFSADSREACIFQECPTIEINYPKFSQPESSSQVLNTNLKTAILEFFDLETAIRDVDQAIEIYINKAQNGYPEAVSEGNPHTLEINAGVSYTSNEVLSIQLAYYQFAGGAHGISGKRFLNYDPRSGSPVNATDFIAEKEDFLAFAKAQFINKYGALDQYWFENNHFNLPKNIGFTDQGLSLYYGLYEIAPYAHGDFELVLHWDEVDPFLNF